MRYLAETSRGLPPSLASHLLKSLNVIRLRSPERVPPQHPGRTKHATAGQPAFARRGELRRGKGAIWGREIGRGKSKSPPFATQGMGQPENQMLKNGPSAIRRTRIERSWTLGAAQLVCRAQQT